MKILAARVNYNENFDNPPRLEILVDEFPEVQFEAKVDGDGVAYFGERDGLVQFYFSDPRDKSGFGGRSFTLAMKDGSEKVITGAWSSNSSYMNSLGFTPSKEVTMTDSPEVWKRGYTFYAGHITLDLWNSALKEFCPDFHVVEVQTGSSFTPNTSAEQSLVIGKVQPVVTEHEIAKQGMNFAQSQAFKRCSRSLKWITELTERLENGEEKDRWGGSIEENRQRHIDHYNQLVRENKLDKVSSLRTL